MVTNYCHNCHHHTPLADGVFCTWCLAWFYRDGRLPAPADKTQDTVSTLYARLDAMEVTS